MKILTKLTKRNLLLNKKIKDYSIRSWQCPRCDSVHDRDYNAANNILDKGIELLLT